MVKRVLFRIAILAVCVLALDIFLVSQLSRRQMNDQTVDVSLQLAALRARLEKEITEDLLLVQGTANHIAIAPDLSQERFARYARGVLSGDNSLKNLGAAPDFVMRFVYPLEENREILGVDYRDLPNQWDQAKKAKETGEMVVAGPLKLLQGGAGLIGRAPVFVEIEGGKRFWGIVSSVIDVDRLFDLVDIDDFGLDIAIRGVDGFGEEGDVFFGDPQLFEFEDAVYMPVTFPSGSWVIAAVPKDGWTSTPPLVFVVHALLGLLLAIVSFGVYHAGKRDHAIQTIQQTLNQAQSIAHLGSWRLDHSNQDIWWSDETYRIFGVDRKSFAPTLESFMDMVHPEDRQRVLEAFQLSTGTCAGYAVDHRIVRPDGEIRHVQERGETICLDRGGGDIPTHAVGTVLDVTKRARAEEALRASEERWKFAIEGSRDGLWDWDAVTNAVYFSPRWKEMLGYAEHEIGTGLEEWDSRVHPDDKEGVYKDLNAHLEGEAPYYENTHRVLCKDGSYKWILDRGMVISRTPDGKALRVIGTHTDVTEERLIQEELRVAKDRLDLAQSIANVGSWELDQKTGTVNWSDEVFRIFGKDPDAGAPTLDDYTRVVHPEDREAFLAAVETGYRMGAYRTEHRAVLENQQVKHISAIAKVLYTALI